MKNLTVALALVAVLAMVGTTFADLTVGGTTEGVDLGNGLTAYTITVMGSTKFEDLNVVGSVHQMNQNWGYVNPTVYGSMMSPNAAVFDTHLLFNQADMAVGGSGDFAETNDWAGLIAMVDGYTSGNGTFTSSDISIAAKAGSAAYAMLTEPTDFIQIVLSNEVPSVLFEGTYLDAQEVRHSFSEVVGAVPEPSTIIMLIAGGLCLLAVRRRK